MPNAADLLLRLQDLDSAIEAAGNRRQRLPERAALAAADAEVKRLVATRKAAEAAYADAEASIARLEADNASRDKTKARLNAQLKTVIAPREAEALMHEIERIDGQRSEADDQELEYLDAQEQAMAAQLAAEEALEAARPVAAEAKAALAAAEAEIDAEVAGLREQRSDVVTEADSGAVDRYEALRKQFGGIAIARLSGTRCGACHLDQSSTAMEALRHHSGDEPLECEQCGRLLVA